MSRAKQTVTRTTTKSKAVKSSTTKARSKPSESKQPARCANCGKYTKSP